MDVNLVTFGVNPLVIMGPGVSESRARITSRWRSLLRRATTVVATQAVERSVNRGTVLKTTSIHQGITV